MVKGLIDCFLFMGQKGLPFREYQGLGTPNINKGNFLELLKLIAKYDSVMASPLSGTDGPNYMSHQSQNEMMASLANETLQTIKNKIKKCQF